MGELLKELARTDPVDSGKAGRAKQLGSAQPEPAPKSEYAATLEDQGIPRSTAKRFEALANVPAETFEAALKAPEKPSAGCEADR